MQGEEKACSSFELKVLFFKTFFYLLEKVVAVEAKQATKTLKYALELNIPICH